jgi:large subunit ribosomal protein L21
MKKIAVIAAGGKQRIVSEGDLLRVEKIEAPVGSTHSFDQVLLIDNGTETILGAPALAGKKVAAEIVAHGREKKKVVLRYRQKSRWQVKKGHRQHYTSVKITSIA